jgi:two-component system chemotaxis sensor kinase CheA
MVIFRNRLDETLARGLAALPKELRQGEDWTEVEAAHQTLGRTLQELQGGIMELRMVPLGSLFGQLKRIVFDESGNEGKEVALRTGGGETPLDKALLEVASEAMGHLVRNAVIHGIESPATRREAGKPVSGTLRIAAAAQGEEVVIDIEDDGAGVDRQALLAAARARGHELPDEVELTTLLALPGVSSRQTADRSAGRGMGMAAVMESVRRRGGHVEVASRRGAGTRFRLRLPLTAAILRALLVEADGEVYALPLAPVQETVALGPERLHEVNRAQVLRWRGQLVSLVDLGVAFATAPRPRREGFAILLESEGRWRGITVDRLVAIQDVVVKPFDDIIGSPPALAGTTILGDGRVVLILDPTGLANLSPILEHTT